MTLHIHNLSYLNLNSRTKVENDKIEQTTRRKMWKQKHREDFSTVQKQMEVFCVTQLTALSLDLTHKRYNGLTQKILA